jgi:hypothetical protein
VLATFSPRNVSVKITLYEKLICEAKKNSYLAHLASAEFPAGKRQPFIRISRKTLEYRLGHTHDASTYPATRVTDPPETYAR